MWLLHVLLTLVTFFEFTEGTGECQRLDSNPCLLVPGSGLFNLSLLLVVDSTFYITHSTVFVCYSFISGTGLMFIPG